MKCFRRKPAYVSEVRQTQLHPQTPSWWTIPAWLGFVLLESREMDWSPWASPVNEGSCCSLRKAVFSFPLPDTRAPVQMQHPSHAAGHGLISRAGSPHAELPWREETNYLLSASSLSFTWETLFYFPHLHIHRKHLSSSHFLIWVMNFYFLAFQRLLFLLLAGCPSTLHISRQFFFQLPERGKKKIFVLFILAFRLTFSCFVNSILSNPWKCFSSCPSPWGFSSQQFVQLSRQGGLWTAWMKSELLLPTQIQLQDLYRRKSHLHSKRGGVLRGKTWAHWNLCKSCCQ